MKHFLSFFIFLGFAVVHAQYVHKSQLLMSAQGHSINMSENRMMQNKNVIIHDNIEVRQLSIDESFTMSKTHQSFLNIHTRKIRFQDKLFYVIFVDKWAGHYKYPEYSREWLVYRTTKAFIFDESEFEKLRSQDGLIEVSTRRTASSGSVFSPYSEDVMTNRIMEEIGIKKSINSPIYKFIVRFDGDRVKFLVPQYAVDGLDLNKTYFEVDKKSFSSTFLCF